MTDLSALSVPALRSPPPMDDGLVEDDGEDTKRRVGTHKKKDRAAARKPRRNMASFLSLVSRQKPHKARRGTGRAENQPNPYVSRLADVHLLPGKTSRLPVAVSIGSFPELQHVSQGAVRGAVSLLPMSELRAITAFLLLTGGITQPDNFVKFEELSEKDGGREVLLHEIMKEPTGVLDAYYQLHGRLKHGATWGTEVDQDGRQRYVLAASDRFLKQERSPNEHNTYKNAHFLHVFNDEDKMLIANQGVPYDDPYVYVKHPARAIEGRLDYDDNVLVDLCGEEIGRFLARTAMEMDVRPELDINQFERDTIAQRRRALCPVRSTDVEGIVDKVRRGEPFDTPNPLDDISRQKMLQLGFTEELLEELYGRAANDRRTSTQDRDPSLLAEWTPASALVEEDLPGRAVDPDLGEEVLAQLKLQFV